MNISVYPTKFEAFDETNELLFIVEMFDECSATVEIKTVLNTESWNEISSRIGDCLGSMGLK